ncbi:MAG: hypothetical protein ABIP27_19795 [Flavobacterium circumlabens]|jgi:hypothetical protein|uniref:Bacteriocin n=1 Tax=Flavobacterium azizsancarii TaxID=2961580 RepID=A0ABT4W9U9_9FLAO|nr:hypothetical protein [Flavobacterium azizsancarii]MDA6069338.1 hypothetical protein [Flavobacterium azizsancarii]
MKKLSLKNMKVVKLTEQEKKSIKGGYAVNWETSEQCNRTSGPYVQWCNVH